LKEIKVNHAKGERPQIKLTVRRVESTAWHSLGFSKHHYLTSELNKSCKCLVFEWEGVPIAFVGVLNTPRKGVPYGCAISRMVILPDYQGLGLSTEIFNFVGGIVLGQSTPTKEYKLYIKTAHEKFGEALSRNENVRPTPFDKKGRRSKDFDVGRYSNRLTRVSYCKEYIGPKIEGYSLLLEPITELRNRKVAIGKL
jgi:hypothetical protein